MLSVAFFADAKANCKLQPPESPSISRISPAKKRDGYFLLERLFKSSSSRLTPPAVIMASCQAFVPLTLNISNLNKCTRALSFFPETAEIFVFGSILDLWHITYTKRFGRPASFKAGNCEKKLATCLLFLKAFVCTSVRSSSSLQAGK